MLGFILCRWLLNIFPPRSPQSHRCQPGPFRTPEPRLRRHNSGKLLEALYTRVEIETRVACTFRLRHVLVCNQRGPSQQVGRLRNAAEATARARGGGGGAPGSALVCKCQVMVVAAVLVTLELKAKCCFFIPRLR